jgi:type 1 glutamine amidotransferase
MTRLGMVHAITVLALLASNGLSSVRAAEPRKVLVVTVTKGFRHASIPTTEAVLQKLSQQSGAFTLDYARTDEDLVAKATVKALAGYDGVVFASTTGDLPLPDRDGFLSWIEAGHAFVGIHAATDTFPGFPPYLAMIGAQFDYHKEQAKVELLVKDEGHPATRTLGKSVSTFDEIYLMKKFDPLRVHLLLALDKHPNTAAPGEYPLAWTREHGKGRVFYTALGHREDVLEAEWFQAHLRGGLEWALGIAR